MNYSKYISELDSHRFGFKVAKIEDEREVLDELLDDLKLLSVKLVISRIDLNDTHYFQILQDSGFKVMDVQLTYSFKKSDSHMNLKSITNTNLLIRKFRDSDLLILKNIAKNSFNNYGHYSVDPKIDKVKAGEIYIDWIERSCLDYNVADLVYVAEFNKIPVGFLAFKIFNKPDSRYVAGVIGAVDTTYRNMNIFKQLINAGNLWAFNNNADLVEHNVLANNLPVNNSFISSGFRVSKSFVTLHKWL